MPEPDQRDLRGCCVEQRTPQTDMRARCKGESKQRGDHTHQHDVLSHQAAEGGGRVNHLRSLFLCCDCRRVSDRGAFDPA